MNDCAEVLWRMYNENCIHGRHHGNLRAGVTNLIITITGAALAVISLDKALSPSDIGLTLFLVGLGVFGALFSAKHYERFRAHMARAHECRDALEEQVPDSKLAARRHKADSRHRDEWPTLSALRSFSLCIAVHVVVAVLGVILTVMCMT